MMCFGLLCECKYSRNSFHKLRQLVVSWPFVLAATYASKNNNLMNNDFPLQSAIFYILVLRIHVWPISEPALVVHNGTKCIAIRHSIMNLIFSIPPWQINSMKIFLWKSRRQNYNLKEWFTSFMKNLHAQFCEIAKIDKRINN